MCQPSQNWVSRKCIWPWRMTTRLKLSSQIIQRVNIQIRNSFISLFDLCILNKLMILLKMQIKIRSLAIKQKDDEKIEMTNEMAKEIMECFSLPSKFIVQFKLSIGKPGKTIHLLKKKAANAKERKASKKFSVNYQLIIDSMPNPRNELKNRNDHPSMEADTHNYGENREILDSSEDEEAKDRMD